MKVLAACTVLWVIGVCGCVDVDAPKIDTSTDARREEERPALEMDVAIQLLYEYAIKTDDKWLKQYASSCLYDKPVRVISSGIYLIGPWRIDLANLTYSVTLISPGYDMWRKGIFVLDGNGKWHVVETENAQT